MQPLRAGDVRSNWAGGDAELAGTATLPSPSTPVSGIACEGCSRLPMRWHMSHRLVLHDSRGQRP